MISAVDRGFNQLLNYTLEKNGCKQCQKRVLRLVTTAEPVLVLNITFL